MNADQFKSFINQNYPDYNYLLGVGGSSSNPTQEGTIYDTDWQKQSIEILFLQTTILVFPEAYLIKFLPDYLWVIIEQKVL